MPAKPHAGKPAASHAPTAPAQSGPMTWLASRDTPHQNANDTKTTSATHVAPAAASSVARKPSASPHAVAQAAAPASVHAVAPATGPTPASAATPAPAVAPAPAATPASASAAAPTAAPKSPAVPAVSQDPAPRSTVKTIAKAATPDSSLADQLAALTKSVAQAQAALAALPPSPISGIIFGNFQYHAEPNASPTNKFDLDRAYLTIKLPAGDKMSVRVTADISPQASGTGYMLRAKYGYVQYDFGKSAGGWSRLARIGLLHTVAIDNEEIYWLRWLGVVPNERFGNAVSADVGASTLVSFPRQQGELYVALTNGNGYSKPETDRFKSYAARLTLTPFSHQKGLLRSISFSSWAEVNGAASKFVAGGAGQVGSVGESLARNRLGLFVGLKDPRLTLGLNYTRRHDGTESGANTIASARTTAATDGSLKSVYTIVHPFARADGTPTRLGFVARYDVATPDLKVSGTAHFADGGVLFDLSKRASIAMDYQEQLTSGNVTTFARTQIYALRFVANY